VSKLLLSSLSDAICRTQIFKAHEDTVLVAQPSPAAGSRNVPLRGRIVELESRGETPPEPAGEDARATLLPGAAK
jgi:hypothetical protein